MFSLESPHQGGSIENTKYTIFNIKKKITLNHPNSAAMFFFFPKGLKNEFETAMVNEPSVFKSLKVYCILQCWKRLVARWPNTPKFCLVPPEITKLQTLVWNPRRDISFPIFTRKEVETKRNGKEIKTIISCLKDLSSFLSNIEQNRN